ncbi:MAG: hypothetical protein IPG04_21200 [Polyangiaceae bacterium]|nr:hypothetical protein [Polyangiaceae bacterium]
MRVVLAGCLSLTLLACGAPSEQVSSPRPAVSAASSVGTASPMASVLAAVDAPPTPPLSRTRDEVIAGLLAAVPSKPARSVLLIGIREAEPETFHWLFGGEPAPEEQPAPGYRTLVVDVQDGSVRVVAELPFLVIPGDKGLRYIGDASAVAYEEMTSELAKKAERDGLGDPIPHHYAKTELWETSKRDDVVKVRQQLRNRLMKERKWGETSSETILVQTPTARCALDSWSEWTGGALAIMGGTGFSLSGPGLKADASRLSSWVPDGEVARVATAIIRETDGDEADAVVDLDAKRKFNGGFQEIVPRKEIHACLTRQAGRLSLLGHTFVSSNSARGFDATEPSSPPPAPLAPWNPPLPFGFDVWKAVLPDLTDAVATPSGDVIALLDARGLTLYDVAKQAAVTALEVGPEAAIVAAEAATGEAADRWVKELTAPWPAGVADQSKAQRARVVARKKAQAEEAENAQPK